MIELTRENVLTTMAAVVAEYGADYIYKADERVEGEDEDPTLRPQCVYVENGEPSCFVGHVLVRLGVPYEALAPHTDNDAKGLLDDLSEAHILVYAADAYVALSVAQQVQDPGGTWGEAEAAAKKHDPGSIIDGFA